MLSNIECRKAALDWLCEPDACIKAAGVLALGKNPSVMVEPATRLTPIAAIPGRPLKPELVGPLALPKRSMRTIDGRAALIHALAHIEFNAINLALDAIWRFADMPENYYRDWLKVAAEEAYHFSLLNAHLQSIGYEYGSFSGHDSLWEMVDRTKDDVLARMALVPRTMEARGLDASPQLHNKFVQIGDLEMGEILTIILRDEIGHVAIGNHWFNWLCQQRQLEPIATFETLRIQYAAPKLRPPFNMEARRLAGFSEAELALLS
ncbi:MAG: ferritin-like domain-containing protein [Pseudomonadota bacterium]